MHAWRWTLSYGFQHWLSRYFSSKTATRQHCRHLKLYIGFVLIVSWCSAVQCPDPGSVENGQRVDSSFARYFNGRVTYTCDEGYAATGARVLTCTASGDWSSAPPRCLRKPGLALCLENQYVSAVFYCCCVQLNALTQIIAHCHCFFAILCCVTKVLKQGSLGILSSWFTALWLEVSRSRLYGLSGTYCLACTWSMNCGVLLQW